MPDVLFRFDVDADPQTVLDAVGQIMTKLKEYAETGTPDPVFV